MKRSEIVLVVGLILAAVLMVPLAGSAAGVSAISLLALWTMGLAFLMLTFYLFLLALRGMDCDVLDKIEEGNVEFAILAAGYLLAASRVIAG